MAINLSLTIHAYLAITGLMDQRLVAVRLKPYVMSVTVHIDPGDMHIRFNTGPGTYSSLLINTFFSSVMALSWSGSWRVTSFLIAGYHAHTFIPRTNLASPIHAPAGSGKLAPTQGEQKELYTDSNLRSGLNHCAIWL